MVVMLLAGGLVLLLPAFSLSRATLVAASRWLLIWLHWRQWQATSAAIAVPASTCQRVPPQAQPPVSRSAATLVGRPASAGAVAASGWAWSA